MNSANTDDPIRAASFILAALAAQQARSQAPTVNIVIIGSFNSSPASPPKSWVDWLTETWEPTLVKVVVVFLTLASLAAFAYYKLGATFNH